VYTGVIVAWLVAGGPILWTLFTSFKTQKEVFTFPPPILPESLQPLNYVQIFSASEYQLFAWNSVVVAVVATIVTMVIATLAAYGFSAFRFRGNSSLMTFILITRMIPGIAFVVPLYLVVQWAGLYDTRTNLVLIYTATALPLAVWLLKISFDTVPRSLIEAAHIDGCGTFKVLGIVILPVAAPGVMTTVLITFLTHWNEFFFAQIFTSGPDSKTLPVAVGELTGAEYGIHWGNLCALGMAIIIPVLLVAIAAQRYVVSGLTAGSVK
jgi:multiple sugar transport system permease protein